jgi:hypothetical protein
MGIDWSNESNSSRKRYKERLAGWEKKKVQKKEKQSKAKQKRAIYQNMIVG